MNPDTVVDITGDSFPKSQGNNLRQQSVLSPRSRREQRGFAEHFGVGESPEV